MRDAEERRKKMATKKAGGINSHAFQTNFAHEIQTLNNLKSKFKQISNIVIQDLFGVLQDADLVGDILQMAFPNLFDSKAIGWIDSIFNKPKNLQPRKAKITGTKFWTGELIKKFLYRRYGGQDAQYDEYFRQGMDEQHTIMQRIRANRNKAMKLRFKGKPGDMRVIDLLAQIKQDEMEMEKIKSRTSEQAFNSRYFLRFTFSRNDEESVNAQIDLHGQIKIFALQVTNQRLKTT